MPDRELDWFIRVTLSVSWWAEGKYHFGGRVTVERIQDGGMVLTAGEVIHDLIDATGRLLGIPDDADLLIRVGQFQR